MESVEDVMVMLPILGVERTGAFFRMEENAAKRKAETLYILIVDRFLPRWPRFPGSVAKVVSMLMRRSFG